MQDFLIEADNLSKYLNIELTINERRTLAEKLRRIHTEGYRIGRCEVLSNLGKGVINMLTHIEEIRTLLEGKT